MLTSEFVKPNGESDYGGYVNYVFRAEVLNLGRDKEEVEAHDLLKQCYSGYMDYMARSEAVDQLPAFSIEKDIMEKEDIEKTKSIFRDAQKNGSVLWTDVISFKNEFLEEQGLYNPETGDLDMKRLRDASTAMMDSFFQAEEIEGAYWFACVHQNTEHVHIHFSTVEPSNTRVMMQEKDGQFSPRGKRKLGSIKSMKSSFSNTLVDNSALLSRMTILRDSLQKEIKEEYGIKKDDLNIAQELCNMLPESRRDWMYAKLPEETQRKLDRLTDELMGQHPHFLEYRLLVRKGNVSWKKLYGESKAVGSDYEGNKNAELYKRLGNAILGELRNMEKTSENSAGRSQTAAPSFPKDRAMQDRRPTTNPTRNREGYRYEPPIIDRRSLSQVRRALYHDWASWKAELDYERTQAEIKFIQQRRI